MGTKRKQSSGVVAERPLKKAKAVTGDKMKIKKLAELKKVQKQLDKMFPPPKPFKQTAKEKKIDKLFEKKTKLKEQLGIE